MTENCNLEALKYRAGGPLCEIPCLVNCIKCSFDWCTSPCVRGNLQVNYTYVVSCDQCDQIGRFFAFWASIPVATIILPKLLSFLLNLCKGVKIIHFSSKIIFGQLLQTFGNFLLVTLVVITYRNRASINRISMGTIASSSCLPNKPTECQTYMPLQSYYLVQSLNITLYAMIEWYIMDVQQSL